MVSHNARASLGENRGRSAWYGTPCSVFTSRLGGSSRTYSVYQDVLRRARIAPRGAVGDLQRDRFEASASGVGASTG
jgi:hypothetical protein